MEEPTLEMKKDFEKWLDSIEESSIAIVSLPPISIYSYALEAARLCDAIVSIELYGVTRYKQFEKMMDIINSNDIKYLGVIADC